MNNTSKLLLGGIVSLFAMFGLVITQTFITTVHDHHHVWHMHMHAGNLEMGLNSMWLVEFSLLVLIGLAIAWFVREFNKSKA